VRIEASLAAADIGICHPSLKQIEPGTVVAGYHPIRSEIDPRPLLAMLAQNGARLCLPAVINRTTIEFRELVRGAPMVKGGFGTSSPDESAQILQPQVLVMPLSVFDNRGNRIGYGAGHYDRYIAGLLKKDIKPVLIGMAFATQQVDNVPHEAHDQPLDCIITETQCIEPAANPAWESPH